MDIIKLIADAGVAGALIAVVVLFLRFTAHQATENRGERNELREVIVNHLEHVANSISHASEVYSKALNELASQCRDHQTKQEEK